MYIVKEIRDRFPSFAHLQGEERTRAIENLLYIETLAASQFLDVSSQDVSWVGFDYRSDGDGDSQLHPIEDRTEVNRRFAELAAGMRKREADPRLHADVAAALTQAKREADAEIRVDLQERLASHTRLAQEAMRNASHHLTLVARARTGIERIDGRAPDIATQINDAMSSRAWTYLSTSGTTVELATVGDVILNEYNPDAGIDLRVNFGRLKVSLDFARGLAYVYPHERNLIMDRYYHPHVDPDGSICWGNMSGEAARLFSRGAYGELLRTLSALLYSYNPDNPFRSLYDFHCAAEEKARVSAEKTHTINREICGDCDEYEDSCECDRCSDCNRLSDNCRCERCDDCYELTSRCECSHEEEETDDDEEGEQDETPADPGPDTLAALRAAPEYATAEAESGSYTITIGSASTGGVWA